MAPRCAERETLAKAVVDSTTAMYEAKKAYEAVRNAKPPDHSRIDKASERLQIARQEARKAQHGFDDHVVAHHCKAE
jgi:hypothetical protein